MFYFCTYLDSNYLTRGLALYRSLVRYVGSFRLWVLCFDDRAYQTLQKLMLPQVKPIFLGDFEKDDEVLLRAKRNRSRIEYYFTCTPSLALYILREHPEVDIITYLDSDLFFFSTPSPVYKELGDNSILIVKHRFPPRLTHLERYGIFNVGFLSFRRDSNGLQCLNWWRRRCIEWCYDRVENGRFADQKYLDDWPNRFSGVVVLQCKGAGLAPWNVGNYSLRLNNGHVTIDAQDLVFFHFHGLRQIKWWLYDPNLGCYGVRADRLLKRYIYGYYIQELWRVARCIFILGNQPHIHTGSIRGGSQGVSLSGSRTILRKMVSEAEQGLAISSKVLRGDLWVMVAGRVV